MAAMTQTAMMRRTVAFGDPEEDVDDDDDYVHVASPPSGGRQRSATISEGVSPRVPALDVQSPLPPPRACTASAARLLRTQSGDADLCALQRLFPEDTEYHVAAPGRSLLWEGRCTCLCNTGDGSALGPARPPQQLPEKGHPASREVAAAQD